MSFADLLQHRLRISERIEGDPDEHGNPTTTFRARERGETVGYFSPVRQRTHSAADDLVLADWKLALFAHETITATDRVTWLKRPGEERDMDVVSISEQPTPDGVHHLTVLLREVRDAD